MMFHNANVFKLMSPLPVQDSHTQHSKPATKLKDNLHHRVTADRWTGLSFQAPHEPSFQRQAW